MDLEPWCQNNPQILHHWFEVERLTDSRRFVLLTVRFSKVDPCLTKKNPKKTKNDSWTEIFELSSGLCQRHTGSPQFAGVQAVSTELPTFHFGEGKHRTVAGGQRGNPCRVFLHDDELGWAELRTASTTSLRLIWCRHQTSWWDPWCF